MTHMTMVNFVWRSGNARFVPCELRDEKKNCSSHFLRARVNVVWTRFSRLVDNSLFVNLILSRCTTRAATSSLR